MSSSTKGSSGYHHGDLRRALVDTATAIVTEEQNWEFSLREVARRAEVSHNAPYRHFPEKLDLLAAIAAEAFEALGTAMTTAANQTDTPEAALVAIGQAYAQFGVENPARYRLMFSTALGPTRLGLPPLVAEATVRSKAVLERTVEEGVRTGCFAAPDKPGDAALIALAAWSIMHGLTMLLIDGLTSVEPSAELFEQIGLVLLRGVSRG